MGHVLASDGGWLAPSHRPFKGEIEIDFEAVLDFSRERNDDALVARDGRLDETRPKPISAVMIHSPHFSPPTRRDQRCRETVLV